MRAPRCRRCAPPLFAALCAAAGLACLLLYAPLLRSTDDGKDHQEVATLALTSMSVLDGSQRYSVRHFWWVGDRWRQASGSGGAWSTCLALHASLSHAHHVEQQASAWSGALSVALFAAGDDVHLLVAYIMFLRRCSTHVRDRVSFHLVWPSDQPPNETLVWGWDPLEAVSCSEDREQVAGRLLARQTRPVGEQLAYPQNLARNTARQACPTTLSLCPDVDMVPGPSIDLAAELADLFNREPPCKRCAYILPVFEVDSSVSVPPADKWALGRLVRGGLARAFHWRIFRENQKPLDPQRWLRHGNASAARVAVAYPVKYAWAFEPIYVAARGQLPLFDEIFVGYGFTRNTQAYEMFVSGWRFFVLDNAFLIHWGLQSMKKRPKWRWKENEVNDVRFRKWTSRVALKYDRDPLNLMRRYPDLASNMTACGRKNCKTARPKPTKSTASTKKAGHKAQANGV